MTNDKLRRQITAETARRMSQGQEPNLGRARTAAARSLLKGWVRPADFPSELEIREELQSAARMSQAIDTASGGEEEARFRHFRRLLEPLTHVLQSREHHPEGDALYHSLQVFALTLAERPWDEELLLAALLHDVGKGFDPLEPTQAGLDALADVISPRTRWLIENLQDAQRVHDGTIGRRALQRLRAHEDFDALLILARCDREGRVPGAQTPTLDEALEVIDELARLCDG